MQLAEGSFYYDASSPPSSTTLNWVSIPPTLVTGSFFVGATVYGRADGEPPWYDNDGVTLSYDVNNGERPFMGATATHLIRQSPTARPWQTT